MRVRIVLLQELIKLAGTHELVLELPEGATVRDLLNALPESVRSAVMDERGEIRYPAEIMVNGRRIEFLMGLDTPLRDGDTVHISPRALFVV
ncbi:MAG: MoaD/ThiS family protein [Desulfurococcales archaeon]|nr:MoaD/ThiS family protein [Desulfurococcales archaeon]